MAFVEAVIGIEPSSVASSFTIVNTGVAIPAGATLRIGIGGTGYSAAAATGFSVSDNQNGSWTSLYSSGDQDQDGTHHYSLAVFQLVNSKAVAAGSLTITVDQTPGQSGTAAIADYLAGGPTSGTVYEVAADNPTNNSLTGNSVAQSITGATAGDYGTCFGVSYATGGSLTANSGTDVLDDIGASGGPPVLWLCTGTSLTTAGTNTFSVDVAGGASFMATWAAGYLPSGGSSPQTAAPTIQTLTPTSLSAKVVAAATVKPTIQQVTATSQAAKTVAGAAHVAPTAQQLPVTSDSVRIVVGGRSVALSAQTVPITSLAAAIAAAAIVRPTAGAVDVQSLSFGYRAGGVVVGPQIGSVPLTSLPGVWNNGSFGKPVSGPTQAAAIGSGTQAVPLVSGTQAVSTGDGATQAEPT